MSWDATWWRLTPSRFAAAERLGVVEQHIGDEVGLVWRDHTGEHRLVKNEVRMSASGMEVAEALGEFGAVSATSSF
ncbi:hypothetical protein [Lentzea nigeriaca]|uniref:hypothetical protein n=1 Tax=Lentzea nigeriaca TaxID=1128665 RepID=UPI00195DCBB5|nr:hypothetical protein [Lentzea nigeriaca]MBM7860572.1 hypothetical protein [Lentzea nigeriaca]